MKNSIISAKKKDMRSGYDRQVDTGRELFLRYDAGAIAEKFGLKTDEKYLYIAYLGKARRISRETGAVGTLKDGSWMECRSYTAVMTIYDILCHNTDRALPSLTGKWEPLGGFTAAGARPDPDYFTQKYANTFSGHIEQLRKACTALGGELLPALAGADVTARLPAFSFFPVLLQFWEGDEEFLPRIRLFLDKNALLYMHFETTYYLQGDLLDAIMEKYKTNEEI